MLTFGQAQRIADVFLEAIQHSGEDLRLAFVEPEACNGGWLFLYDNSAT